MISNRKFRLIVGTVLVVGIAAQAGLRPSAERLELLQTRFDEIRREAEKQNRLSGGTLSVVGLLSLGAGIFMSVAKKANRAASDYLMGAGALSIFAGTFTLMGANDFERFAYEHSIDRMGSIGGESERIRIAEERLQELRRTARFQKYFTNGLLVGLGAFNISLYEKQRWGVSAKQYAAESGLAATGLGLWRSAAERRFESGGVLAGAGLIQLAAFAWDNDPAWGYLLGSGMVWAGLGIYNMLKPRNVENEYKMYETERGEAFISWSPYPIEGGAGLQAYLSF